MRTPKGYKDAFIAGCQLYIESRFEEALKAFDTAREIQTNIWVDLWRARTMMDAKDCFHAVQLVEWMIKEYNGDVRVHLLRVMLELEVLSMQPDPAADQSQIISEPAQ